jgi:hypothetical protein
MTFKMNPSNTFRKDLKENPEAAIFMLKSFIYVLNNKSIKDKKYLELCKKYFSFKKDELADDMLTIIKFQQTIFNPILSEMIKLKNSKYQVE